VAPLVGGEREGWEEIPLRFVHFALHFASAWEQL